MYDRSESNVNVVWCLVIRIAGESRAEHRPRRFVYRPAVEVDLKLRILEKKLELNKKTRVPKLRYLRLLSIQTIKVSYFIGNSSMLKVIC